MKKLDGYFPVYWDERHGQLWLEVADWNKELLFIGSMASGIGSSDIGLDRGEMGDEHVVKFERVGPKVLLEEVNLKHRTSSADAAERAAVVGSFPSSVLWGSTVAAEDPGGRVLVDATSFFSSDVAEVGRTLKDAKQGKYELDSGRSAVSFASTRNFPDNTEVESVLTFVDKDPDADKHEPGSAISDASATATIVTVREHYSLVRLPDRSYQPRAYDARAGFFDVSYEDFGMDVSQPIEQRVVCRHRLQKKDPAAPVSDPVRPIVFYVDPAIPEPIRSAIVQGASWWSDAFTAAGFRNAFRVEMRPPDTDPMDIRYNDIEWVHRASRGWSYGRPIVDPRTGEILKGHVILGSKRARQDYLIFEGLLAPYAKGQPTDPRLMKMVLGRLRQLAAHEVGHSLGLRHNFAASVIERASVMDYPPPRVSLAADGSLDTGDAYASGIGKWDVAAIRWGYSQFTSPEEEKRGLEAIVSATEGAGLPYLSDEDARAPSSASPAGSLWDDGRDPVDELAKVVRVRSRALARFGEDNLAPGMPLAQLENVLVPIYLYHRYQLEAATHVIGGYRYAYAVRGGHELPLVAVPADEQRRALSAVLATVTPEALTIPDRVLALLPPQPPGYQRTRESFASYTSPTFDPVGAAQAAAQLTFQLLLDSERAARLVEAAGAAGHPLTLSEVIDAVWKATWKAPAAPKSWPVRAIADEVALQTVMALVSTPHASPEVRAVAYGKLQELRAWAAAQQAREAGDEQRAHLQFAVAQIKKLDVAPGELLKSSEPVKTPPGQPIGAGWEDDE